jgi:hypothetical protein
MEMYMYKFHCVRDGADESSSLVYPYLDAVRFLNENTDNDCRYVIVTKNGNPIFETSYSDKLQPYQPSMSVSLEKSSLVDSNLKTAAAVGKPTLSAVPPVGLLALGAAMQDGCTKYGRFNFRETGATSSVFYDAILRHLLDWYSGEDFAPDSKVHHLGHIMASCAILLDCELHKSLNDDRQKVGPVVKTKAWKDCD